MKKLLVVLSFFLLVYGACPSAPGSNSGPSGAVNPLDFVPVTPDTENNYPPETMADKTAFDFFRDEGLSVGWNLGNTLDAYINGKSNETGWGNPPANQSLFDGVKKAGFNVVRIPVSWMGYIGPAPDHNIQESYLRRVAEVAGYAHNAGFAVIINLHHDGSTDGSGKDNGWLSINKARRNEKGYNEVTHQFVRVWKQVALYFKNYGDWLMFESFNELHDGGWGWSPESQQRPQYDIINKWNQLFTDVVRGTGANNSTRYLVIPGYCTTPKHTLASYFKLPEDSAPGKQVVTFHYYDPYEFGILGDQQGGRHTWGSASDKQKVDTDFKPFKAKFIDNSIPVILGECGAVLQLYPGNKSKEDQARQNRLDYLAHIFSKASEYGIVPIYWDNGAATGNGEKFGLFNRRTGEPGSDESNDCIKAMINAVK